MASILVPASAWRKKMKKLICLVFGHRYIQIKINRFSKTFNLCMRCYYAEVMNPQPEVAKQIKTPQWMIDEIIESLYFPPTDKKTNKHTSGDLDL